MDRKKRAWFSQLSSLVIGMTFMGLCFGCVDTEPTGVPVPETPKPKIEPIPQAGIVTEGLFLGTWVLTSEGASGGCRVSKQNFELMDRLSSGMNPTASSKTVMTVTSDRVIKRNYSYEDSNCKNMHSEYVRTYLRSDQETENKTSTQAQEVDLILDKVEVTCYSDEIRDVLAETLRGKIDSCHEIMVIKGQVIDITECVSDRVNLSSYLGVFRMSDGKLILEMTSYLGSDSVRNVPVIDRKIEKTNWSLLEN